MSQATSPEPQRYVSIVTDKKEFTIEKPKESNLVTNISDEGDNERVKTLEKDKDPEDCHDLVLVESNEEEKLAAEERSQSPEA